MLVAEMLGPARYIHDTNLTANKPGIVTGLAYTPVGGEVLHIEATRFPGKGNITLTGQIGNVMKESMQAALSLVRSRDGQVGATPEEFRESDIHVHVPAGAVPKDGPSAGIAMFTALASLFSNTPVRSDVAMTGEITLRGLGPADRRIEGEKPGRDARRNHHSHHPERRTKRIWLISPKKRSRKSNSSRSRRSTKS